MENEATKKNDRQRVKTDKQQKKVTFEDRKESASQWLKKEERRNSVTLVRAYGKRFSVPVPVAVQELNKLGVSLTENQIEYAQNAKERRKQHLLHKKRRRQEKKERLEREKARGEIEQDESFAMIIGYTSGGAPYGLTWEEMEEISRREQEERKTEERYQKYLKEHGEILKLPEDDDPLPFL